MKKKNSLQIRVSPPSPVCLNGILIIFLLFILFGTVCFSVVNAFSLNKTKKVAQYNLLKGRQASITKDIASVNDLPSSYQQAGKIKQFLQALYPKTKGSDAIQNELTILKQQQAMLQQKLAALHNQNRSHNGGVKDARVRQAANSGLFFPGTSPPTHLPIKTTKSKSGVKQAPYRRISSYEQQNMQSQKMGFLKSSDNSEDIYNINKMEKPKSPYEVQAGTIIHASLLTGINTSLPGHVVSQVQDDIYDTVSGSYLLIPKGSKLLGQYDSQVAYGQERVLLVFTRILRPDGSSIVLDKSGAADLQGQAGMQGDVINHWSKVIGATVLSTLLSVGTGAASQNFSNGNGYYPSFGQNAMMGAAGNVSKIGQNMVNRAIDIQPTLKLPAGFQFSIIVNKDMILEPYKIKNY